MQSIYKQVRNVLSKKRILFGLEDSHKKCSIHSKLYEPAYLETMKSKLPLCDTLNIRIRGYDYPVLENYQKQIHSLFKCMDASVEDCWATPANQTQIIRYKEKSCVIDSEYTLRLFERNVQIADVTGPQYSIIIRLLETSLPEGVMLDIHTHEDCDEEIRYVPDKDLVQLKSQLDDITTTHKKTK